MLKLPGIAGSPEARYFRAQAAAEAGIERFCSRLWEGAATVAMHATPAFIAEAPNRSMNPAAGDAAADGSSAHDAAKDT